MLHVHDWDSCWVEIVSPPPTILEPLDEVFGDRSVVRMVMRIPPLRLHRLLDLSDPDVLGYKRAPLAEPRSSSST